MPRRATRRYIERVAKDVLVDTLGTKYVDFALFLPSHAGQAPQYDVFGLTENIPKFRNDSDDQKNDRTHRLTDDILMRSLQLKLNIKNRPGSSGQAQQDPGDIRVMIIETNTDVQLTGANQLATILTAFKPTAANQGTRSFYTTSSGDPNYAGPYKIIYDRMHYFRSTAQSSFARIYINKVYRYRYGKRISWTSDSEITPSRNHWWCAIIGGWTGAGYSTATNVIKYEATANWRIRWVDS